MSFFKFNKGNLNTAQMRLNTSIIITWIIGAYGHIANHTFYNTTLLARLLITQCIHHTIL